MKTNGSETALASRWADAERQAQRAHVWFCLAVAGWGLAGLVAAAAYLFL